MAKKLKPEVKAKYIPSFKELAEKVTQAKRAKAISVRSSKPKIPMATIFVNGQKIVLNADYYKE